MANQPRAIGFALITLLMWSTVATAFKLTLAYASVLQTLAIASVVSSLVLLILVTLSGKGAVLAGVFFDNWRFTLLAGLLNPVIY